MILLISMEDGSLRHEEENTYYLWTDDLNNKRKKDANATEKQVLSTVVGLWSKS